MFTFEQLEYVDDQITELVEEKSPLAGSNFPTKYELDNLRRELSFGINKIIVSSDLNIRCYIRVVPDLGNKTLDISWIYD